jgi:hypothetical protein
MTVVVRVQRRLSSTSRRLCALCTSCQVRFDSSLSLLSCHSSFRCAASCHSPTHIHAHTTAGEQRSALAASFKHALDLRRATVRKLSEATWKPLAQGDAAALESIKTDRERVQAEVVSLCTDMLLLVEKTLLRAARTAAARVFYYNMYPFLLRFVSLCDILLVASVSLDAFLVFP